ncbi:MAG: DUF2341 domain-containing protein [Euryarchaeota archaeon]|nr:DUF2341 domain-containing protein [Euryarchaeota archaeon]
MTTIYQQFSPIVYNIDITYNKKLLRTLLDIPTSSYAQYTWSDLSLNTTYHWLMGISDGTSTTYSPVYNFTTVSHLYWWNPNWSYCKTLPITNANNSYQMKIVVGKIAGGNVTCEGHCLDNFSDIRFISFDNTTELSYWCENYTSGQQATFWVKTPSNVQIDQKINMYYGNPTAISNGNASATFLFFDDFPGTSLDAAKWMRYTTGTTNCSVSNGILILQSNSGSSNAQCIESNTNYNYGIQLTFKYYQGAPKWKGNLGLTTDHGTPVSVPTQNYSVIYVKGDYGESSNLTTQSYTTMQSVIHSSETSSVQYIGNLKIGQTQQKFIRNNTQLSTTTVTLPTKPYKIHIGEQSYTSSNYTLYVDYLFAHQYKDPEPIWDTPSAEQKQRFEIVSVSHYPNIVGFGFNVTIYADIIDDSGTMNSVKVNITYPDSGFGNFTMNKISWITYEKIFSDTWQSGQYNYTIWAQNTSGYTISSSQYHFNVSALANITVETTEDEYGSDEYVNLTDPPAVDLLYIVERNSTWDTYYDPVTNEYILKSYAEPVNYLDKNKQWQPINTTIEKTDMILSDRAYQYTMNQADYQVSYRQTSSLISNYPVAVLQKNYGIMLNPSDTLQFDNGILVHKKTQSTGIVDNNIITYQDQYGTGIHLRYICQNSGVKNELIIDSSDVLPLQDSYSNLVFKETVRAYYLDGFAETQSMGIKIGRDGPLFKEFDHWGSKEITTGDAIWFTDENDTSVLYIPEIYVYDSDVSHEPLLLNKTLSMTGSGILQVQIDVPWWWLQSENTSYPVFIDPSVYIDSHTSDGYITKSSSSGYSQARNASSGTIYNTTTLYIGQQKQLGRPFNTWKVWRTFLFFDTSSLAENMVIKQTNLTIYKYSTYPLTGFNIVVQNGQPNSPHMSLLSEDYYYGNYSGDGGSFYTDSFGLDNKGVIDFNEDGKSWVNKQGYTKLCLRSSRDISCIEPSSIGYEYEKIYSGDSQSLKPVLTVVYRWWNQSKIQNTGSTNISGYLLMQVQHYNATLESWVLADDTINETNPRIIPAREQLALDTIFNGSVNTNDLTSFGSGLYRVYAALRDPAGNILKTDDEVELAAWYEFTVVN